MRREPLNANRPIVSAIGPFNRNLLLLVYWLLFGVLSVGYAQQRTDLQGIVPGNELKWEIQELRASVVVDKPTLLNLQIYSPGFDANDYRSALKGKPELGDERYDKGKGQILAEFSLLRDGKIIQLQTYGVEKHRWVVFFRGEVEPGVYTLRSRLMGLGKNAFRYRIQTSVPQAAQLIVDPTLQVYDVRSKAKAANPLTIATVRGLNWVEPFVLEVAPGTPPFKVGFYDEDGAGELLGRVRLPDGSIVRREVSGDKSWAYYQVAQGGTIRFGFAQNPQSKQYSNTIGFQVNACLKVSKDRFVVVPPERVSARVLDTHGQQLELSPQITGEQIRIVVLGDLPRGYTLARIETLGGELLDGNKVRFGCAGGEASFIVEKPPNPAGEPQVIVVPTNPSNPGPIPVPTQPTPEPPVDPVAEEKPIPVPLPTPQAIIPQGKLHIEAVLVLPTEEQSVNFPVKVGEQVVPIVDGQAELELDPGDLTLSPQVQGARVEGPSTVTIEPDQTAQVLYKVYPQADLTLQTDKTELRVGETALLTAKATTAFSGFIPADIQLDLPDCLEPVSNPRLVTPISATHEAVFELAVKATCKGEFSPVARLEPWQKTAQVQLRVIQPALFTLEKQTLTPQLPVGATARYQIKVKNIGQEAGQVRVVDNLAVGLQGNPLDQTLQLEAGEEKTLELSALVGSNAPESISNTAQLLDASNNPLAESQAVLQVLRPKAELTRTLDKHIVVPGETVAIALVVRNSGLAPLKYSLSDTYPEWVEPIETPEFSGTLEPGASQTHTYKAKVRLGNEAEAPFMAQVISNGGNPQAPDTLKRLPVLLDKKAASPKAVVGSAVDFVITVSNPTDHPLTIDLQEAPDPDLNLEVPDNLKMDLKPGEVRQITLQAKPQRIGTLENQVTAFVDGSPAAFPAKAAVVVLPVLEPQRLSTLQMFFNLEGKGERILITQLPPAQTQYELGSARLDGKPIPDPKVDASGRLYFDLPFQSSGEVSFMLRHKEALPPLEDSTLTLLSGDREVFIQGKVSYTDFAKAKPLIVTNRDGFIKEPLPGTVFRVDRTGLVVETPYGLEGQVLLNGAMVDAKNLGKGTYDAAKGIQRLEFFGLPLQAGRNIIEVQTGAGSDRVEVFLATNPVRLEVHPVRLLADGRTPLEFEIVALDAAGLPSGFGPLTLEVSPEPLDSDAFPQISGYQVLLRDGKATLRLKPQAGPTAVNLKLQYEQLNGRAEFFATGKQTTLWQIQGNVGVRIGSVIEGFGSMRGYLEAPLGNGTIRAATDGSVRFDKGQHMVENGLDPVTNPYTNFPLTGSGTEAQLPLTSNDPLGVRYDDANTSLGYYYGPIVLPGVGNLNSGTVLRGAIRGNLELQGFAGWLPVARYTEQIVPDGTRYYRLKYPVDASSEQVILRVGAVDTRLQPLRDYVLDSSGILTLANPLWPTDGNFDDVRLVVTYAPQGGTREPGYGVGARYTVGSFSVGAGVASLANGLTSGRDLPYGAELGYQTPDLNFKLSYSRGADERWGLEVGGKQEAFEAAANLNYQGRTQGQARLAYNLSDSDKVSLEHQADAQNQTNLLYSRKVQNFSIGGGLGYTWETKQTALVGRVGAISGPVSVELTHSQPFSLSAQAQTRLQTIWRIDENLSAEGNLTETWGNSLTGTLALKQKLAGANFALTYELPGASGDGNRARFGLEAPFQLDANWSLNANAGYERSLNTGTDQAAFGLAARYKNQGFSATAGAETALSNGQTKVILRTGATGQIDEQQSISFDATYQVLPNTEGRFTLAYALRGSDVTLLTYHRLISQAQPLLEGGLATSYHPNLSFQLRPSAAYRINTVDGTGNTFQIGLGANYYFTDWLGIGGAGYYLTQPYLRKEDLAWALEGNLRILDGLWLNAGYTFGGFNGLTPDTAPGFYIRLDFFGGNR